MNWWVALTLPVWAGINGTLWMCIACVVLLEHIRDQELEVIFGHPERLAKLLLSVLLSTIGYIASVYLGETQN